MPDWTKPMEQSYEYYTVNPKLLTNEQRLDNVISANFNRDSEAETLGSATIDVTQSFGEAYVRGYLKTIQNGVTERFALGTVLVQTPSSSFNGMITNVSMDAYTPLIELKEKRPPLGYTIRKGTKILEAAHRIVSENARIPMGEYKPTYETVNGELVDTSPELTKHFIANADDTWLSFLIDLLALAKYEFGLDELGHILFQPKQELESLQPVWTYDDGNSSILYPEITMDHDLYGVPNVVEVAYFYEGDYKTVTVKNEDPNSPVSIQARGREIVYRDTQPGFTGFVTDEQMKDYAERLLRALSSIEYTISYTHAYCPVRVGDCVRLNYEKAGIRNIKARVVSQSIQCELGCPVSERAVFTTKLWR